MQRYFIKNDQISNNKIMIIDRDFHHIKNVMRMRLNSLVLVCDEDENVYLCEIEEFFQHTVSLNIISRQDTKSELNADITIAMGLTKRDKQEEVLRRITELGASGFLMVEMERSVVKIKEAKSSKHERLQLIVKEASEQSHRNKLLEIHETCSFKDFIKQSKSYDLCLFAYEEAGRANDITFKTIIKSFVDKKIIILVGPEGGISLKEIEILKNNKFIMIGLGPRILRCETAPLYIMSAISYEMELKNEG